MAAKQVKPSQLALFLSHTDASYHHFAPDEVLRFRAELLRWYDTHRRKLPWRGDPPPYNGSTAAAGGAAPAAGAKQPLISKFFQQPPASGGGAAAPAPAAAAAAAAEPRRAVTAYGTWVSEIMLQQTRVETVIPYYLKWMAAYPTPAALAAASPEDINAAWAGLGYYRRARLLHQGAATVAAPPYNGELPSTTEELMKIPGIGAYTAGAIASIAFGQRVPVVDGNVLRVLSRMRAVAAAAQHPPFKDKLSWELAGALVDPERPGDFNQAMMELGATVCAPKSLSLPSSLEPFFTAHIISRELAQQPTAAAEALAAAGEGCPVCAGMAEVVAGLQCGTEAVTLFPCKKPCRETKYQTLAVAVLRQRRPSTEPESGAGDEWWYLMARRPTQEELSAAATPPPAGSKRKKPVASALLAGQCAPSLASLVTSCLRKC